MGKKILYLFVFISVTCWGQRKSIADKYFNEYAYKKSAKLYESLFKKGDTSYSVLSRLGDSYYNNSNFVQAEKWYKELIKRYEKIISPEYVFKYAQVLKSNGKIKESDKWLLKLNNLRKEDSRGEALKQNANYFIEYTNREKLYVNLNNLSINTKYSDFGGFIYGNEFYFASTKPNGTNDKKLYSWNNQPHLSIYKGTESFNEEAKILDVFASKKVESVDSKYHESNAVITADGKTMYFTRTSSEEEKLKGGENKEANLKIYKAEKIGDVWGNITELPFNNDNYSIGHPALSLDEKTLYFISNMPNGYGLTDIYKVELLGGGKYSEPKNLGRGINTEGREMFPFIGDDNTLYFASDGHLGLGALDVFESKFVEGNYMKSLNLGAPINGPYDDFGFVINKKRNNGFFSSNREGGKGDDDIYSFLVYNCKEAISGLITETKTEKPIQNAVVKLIDSTGKVVTETKTKEDGTYTFNALECEKKFTVVASKDDYKSEEKIAKTLDVNKESITTNLQLESLIVEDQIVINPIYFDFDKYDIREDATYELEHVVSVMNNHSEMVIKIESHTDSRGEAKYNKWLSAKRAESTKEYIVSRGISSDRIQSAKGLGEEQLLNDCDEKNGTKCAEEAHQINRRSYFYILNDNKTSEVKIKQGLIYKIQLASTKKQEYEKEPFANLEEAEVMRAGTSYKFYCCKNTSLEKIEERLNQLKKSGYKDAFIVPFLEGKRISIKEALKIDERAKK
ncbi:OmpA family protein [Tenacibaculum aiptasiae]|uniref:OmpA family protein n=1 Tax=Tenacibaculum aiptasiae TaxID=426481 RepID=UPI003B5A9A9E